MWLSFVFLSLFCLSVLAKGKTASTVTVETALDIAGQCRNPHNLRSIFKIKKSSFSRFYHFSQSSKVDKSIYDLGETKTGALLTEINRLLTFTRSFFTSTDIQKEGRLSAFLSALPSIQNQLVDFNVIDESMTKLPYMYLSNPFHYLYTFGISTMDPVLQKQFQNYVEQYRQVILHSIAIFTQRSKEEKRVVISRVLYLHQQLSANILTSNNLLHDTETLSLLYGISTNSKVAMKAYIQALETLRKTCFQLRHYIDMVLTTKTLPIQTVQSMDLYRYRSPFYVSTPWKTFYVPSFRHLTILPINHLEQSWMHLLRYAGQHQTFASQMILDTILTISFIKAEYKRTEITSKTLKTVQACLLLNFPSYTNPFATFNLLHQFTRLSSFTAEKQMKQHMKAEYLKAIVDVEKAAQELLDAPTHTHLEAAPFSAVEVVLRNPTNGLLYGETEEDRSNENINFIYALERFLELTIRYEYEVNFMMTKLIESVKRQQDESQSIIVMSNVPYESLFVEKTYRSANSNIQKMQSINEQINANANQVNLRELFSSSSTALPLPSNLVPNYSNVKIIVRPETPSGLMVHELTQLIGFFNAYYSNSEVFTNAQLSAYLSTIPSVRQHLIDMVEPESAQKESNRTTKTYPFLQLSSRFQLLQETMKNHPTFSLQETFDHFLRSMEQFHESSLRLAANHPHEKAIVDGVKYYRKEISAKNLQAETIVYDKTFMSAYFGVGTDNVIKSHVIDFIEKLQNVRQAVIKVETIIDEQFYTSLLPMEIHEKINKGKPKNIQL